MGGGKFYSSERNIQILISLLKANNINRIIVSPGATNVTFVGSLQSDPFFKIYSCIDERSAAYMALGMAEESGNPVVISCTGATSSREYMPALTAAFYQKLPILAVTSSQLSSRIGQMVAQVTDRRNPPVDAVVASFQVEPVETVDDEWDRTIKVNEAISCLSRNGGGPVHINLVTTYSKDFSVKKIPSVNTIFRLDSDEVLPKLPQGRIAIFVGSTIRFTDEQTKWVDYFCASHDAVVFCDHSSGYYGKYRVNGYLQLIQKKWKSSAVPVHLLIHIGNISGDHSPSALSPQEVWRVSDDGEIKDAFHKLTHVFQMSILAFFRYYASEKRGEGKFLKSMHEEYSYIHNLIPELPFGNIWIAQQTASRFPKNSCVHFGILNSLRSWNMFSLPTGVESQCNVGGFGIDGIASTLVGASLVNKQRLYFSIQGDLSFFYDMNISLNGLVGSNVRIMVINNGLGAEFRLYDHPANRFGNAANPFMAAAWHNGNKSPNLLKNYAEDSGFEYMSASSKEDYLLLIERFLSPSVGGRPILFEVFTKSEDESEAFRIMTNLVADKKVLAKQYMKLVAKVMLGEKGVKFIKNLVSYR